MKKPKSVYNNPNRKKKMRRPEQALQIAIFNFAKPLMAYQKHKEFIAFHIPNGGYRTQYEGYIFKAMGVMPGVADICLLFPEKYVNNDREVVKRIPLTCWIELKAGKGGTTDSQDAFGTLMQEYGFNYRVLAAADAADAVNQFKDILREYGVKF